MDMLGTFNTTAPCGHKRKLHCCPGEAHCHMDAKDCDQWACSVQGCDLEWITANAERLARADASAWAILGLAVVTILAVGYGGAADVLHSIQAEAEWAATAR